MMGSKPVAYSPQGGTVLASSDKQINVACAVPDLGGENSAMMDVKGHCEPGLPSAAAEMPDLKDCQPLPQPLTDSPSLVSHPIKDQDPEQKTAIVAQEASEPKQALQPRTINCDEAIKQANGAPFANLATPQAPSFLANEPEGPPPSLPTTGTPTAHGLLLASPHRPLRPATAAATTVPPTATPLSPPGSAIKNEQQAALTLAWLAEAITHSSPPADADNNRSMLGADDDTMHLRVTDTPFALQQYPARPGTGTTLRGRRPTAKANSMMDYTYGDEEDEYLTTNLLARQRSRASLNAARAARRAQRATGAAAALEAEEQRSKPKFHGQHSRVGRAMTSIVDFILKNYEKCVEETGNGVPERVVRLEFGNNPDTSKALRLLVSEKKIVRCGAGGRKDPFHYMLAEGFSPVPLDGPPPFPRTSSGSPTAAEAETRAGTAGEGVTARAAHGLETKTPAAALAMTLASPPPTTLAAAAAAALAVPSTAKQAAPPATQLRGAARRKRSQSQHRLSLALAEAAVAPEEVNADQTTAAAAVNTNDEDNYNLAPSTAAPLGGVVTSDTCAQEASLVSGRKRARKPSAKLEESKATEEAMAMLEDNKFGYGSTKRHAPSSFVAGGPAAKRPATTAAVMHNNSKAGAAQVMMGPGAGASSSAHLMPGSVAAPQLPMLPGLFLSPTAVEAAKRAQAAASAAGDSSADAAAPLDAAVSGPQFGNIAGGPLLPGSFQAAYLMQLQAAQLYWRQQFGTTTPSTATKQGSGAVTDAGTTTAPVVAPQLPAVQPLQTATAIPGV